MWFNERYYSPAPDPFMCLACGAIYYHGDSHTCPHGQKEKQMAEELSCTRQARETMEQALATFEIQWSWIELSNTIATREDRLGTHLTTSTWRVSLEGHLPDGHGHHRHQILDESAPQLSQAVARMIDRLAEQTEAKS